MKKHTEWITAVEFSPDGVLLATGDRNNGLIVWEAQTGREFYDLRGPHRGHHRRLAGGSTRTSSPRRARTATVKLWEMENGGKIKTIGAHGGGVESVRFAKDGRLVTDRPRPHGPALGRRTATSSATSRRSATWPSRPSSRHDESKVIAADWSGEVRVWDAKDGQRLANLAVNPAPDRRPARPGAAGSSPPRRPRPIRCPSNSAPLQDAAARRRRGPGEGPARAHRGRAGRREADRGGPAARPGSEGEGRRGRRGRGHAPGRRAARRAGPVGAVRGREGRRPSPSQAEKAAIDALTAAKAATEKALADKTAHDPAVAAAAAALKAAKTPEATAKAAAELAKQAQKVRRADPGPRRRGLPPGSATRQNRRRRPPPPRRPRPRRRRLRGLVARAASLAVQSARDADRSALDQEKAAADKALADARAAPPSGGQPRSPTSKKDLEQATAAKAAADKALAEKRAPLDAAVARAKALKAELDALSVESKRSGAKGGLAATSPAGPQAKR